MAKKSNQSDTATWSRDKAGTDKERIAQAIAAIAGVQGAQPAIDILTRLTEHAGQRWLDLKEVQYAYADKIYSSRHWLTAQQNALPPGTTFLGIVLDKTLEVSVVETFKSNPNREYHRPMTILPKGALFGTFETADLMCQTELLQDYTVFSGLRTFFFSDPAFEPNVTGRDDFETAMKSIARNGQFLAAWLNKDLSPTQTPLCFLGAFLAEKLKAWKSKILLIAVGSEFLSNVSDQVKHIIWRGAWRQSAHLRQQSIAAYSTDEIMQILGGKTDSGTTKVSEKFRSAIARELKTLPMLFTDSRPGFRRIVAASRNQTADLSKSAFVGNPATNDFGPFGDFFEAFGKQITALQTSYYEAAAALEPAVYVPEFLFDSNHELILPFWPNYDPSGSSSGKKNDDLKEVLSDTATYWPAIKDKLLVGDLGYSKHAAILNPWPKDTDLNQIKKQFPSLLRGPVRIQDTVPCLPLFTAVDRLPNGQSAGALIAVQHLMEETVCLLREIINRQLVQKDRIWLLGKPYSSNHRVAHRLSKLGITVTIPEEGTWLPGGEFEAARGSTRAEPGRFDEWFDGQVGSFLARTLAETPKTENGPILLLDDGGALIKSAAKFQDTRRFRGIEQTSRGIASACAAKGKFPVILVACSAVKSIVEPEFVARAAVNKIARYYPEALQLKKVGIVGFGNLAKYLAKYIKQRPDIHGAENVDLEVLCFDRNRKPEDPASVPGWCSTAAELFAKADLVYGCAGEDYGDDAANYGKAGQLLVSISSGDVEFATLLRSMSAKEREEYEDQRGRYGPLAPVKTGNKIVAHGGFPITFDRSPSSAPLVEMQLTRALLLAGIQQAVSLDSQSKEPLPLRAKAQHKIWTNWEEHALTSTLPELTPWQQQREREFTDSPDLKKRARAITDEKDVEEKNTALFKDATERFLQRSRRTR